MTRDSRFVRWAEAAGDLGSPFFAEERQRDVWNEASAVGLQVVLLLSFVMGGAFYWIGGRAGIPYGVGMSGVVGLGALVTVQYASRLGVRVIAREWLSQRRLALIALLVLFQVGGLVRASRDLGGGFAAGVSTGVVLGLLGMGWFSRRAVRAATDGTSEAEPSER